MRQVRENRVVVTPDEGRPGIDAHKMSGRSINVYKIQDLNCNDSAGVISES